MYDMKNLNDNQLSYLKKQYSLNGLFIFNDTLLGSYRNYVMTVYLSDYYHKYVGSLIDVNAPVKTKMSNTVNNCIKKLID